jgi:hypothetical protein
VNEIVINNIEIRPVDIPCLEFDDEGTALISLIAITPGSYEVSIPGIRGDTQRAIFNTR